MKRQEAHGGSTRNGGATGTELLMKLSTNIVSAYVARNFVLAAALPDTITVVYDTLSGLKAPKRERDIRRPAVPISKSVTDDYIVCLEDGGKYKSLKCHLRVRYGLSADEYREKWGLPPTYPMAARNYRDMRSRLARSMAFGRRSRRNKALPATKDEGNDAQTGS